MEFLNPFGALQGYKEVITDSEISMIVHQGSTTSKGKKRRALSSPEKRNTPTPTITPKSMLLRAKTLIERAIREETDHANKVNLESAILDLQIALGQKPRDSIEATWNRKLDQLERNMTAKLEKIYCKMESRLGKHPQATSYPTESNPTTSYPTTSTTSYPTTSYPATSYPNTPCPTTTNGQTMDRTPGQIPNGQISNQVTDRIDQQPTYTDITKNLYKFQKCIPPADATTKETNTGIFIEVDSPTIPTNKPWVVITKKPQKGTPAKIEKPLHHREKRLILSPSDGMLQIFNPMKIRNAINDRFSAKLGQIEPVVITVTKSYSQQSIVLTITD